MRLSYLINMLTIKLNNPDVELDKRFAKNAKLAAMISIEMIKECGELYPGDTITIEGKEDEE